MLTFWFHVYPDLDKPIGGVKQVHRSAELIESLGFQCFLVQDSKTFHPRWFKSSVKCISRQDWNSLELDPSTNFAVFAETFILAIPKLRRGLPAIIFNQNFAYSFGLPSQKLFDPSTVLRTYQSNYIRQVWCVSEYDRQSLLNIGVPSNKVFTISNSIDALPFPSGCQKNRQICYMPRKNSVHSDIVVNLLKSRPNLESWNFMPISDFSHDQVILTLQASLIFLSFGHPEGFGLPVAEALISGCAVIGYTGLGGRELFDMAAKYHLAWPIEFGDLQFFLPSVDSCIETFLKNKSEHIAHSRALSNELHLKYSKNCMQASFSDCLNLLV